MTHTPGPWRVGDAGHTIFRPDKPSAIATICKQDEFRANARLIAAAPDLLASLKALIACHDRPHGFPEGTWYDRDLTKARAAIAKAEGQP